MSSFFKFTILTIIAVIGLFTTITAQSKSTANSSKNPAIMWVDENISKKDLFWGPGGMQMQPDLSRITFIKEDKSGTSKKYRIKDGSGNIWVAKLGNEAQSETAAVRLIWALGYKTEINYLVPKLMIPGKGVFTNVRLEARPENIDRGKNWEWKKNPFLNTREFQGLKIMMAFLNNWDLKKDNNIIFKNDELNENHYVISDLGVAFGKLGSNSLPIFWRIGRSRNNPEDYSKSKFINGVKKERLRIFYRGKNSGIFDNITIEDGIWLSDLLNQLSEKQINDAFRAANYSRQNIRLLSQTVQKRIANLDEVTRFAASSE